MLTAAATSITFWFLCQRWLFGAAEKENIARASLSRDENKNWNIFY
jgi:hypothetical protein